MRKKITIIIPCHNEERGIGRVIDAIPVKRLSRLGYITDIIVIDNNSTDKTRQVALSRNVKVIHEARKGKGHAIRTGLRAIHPQTDYVVMLDGDNTYKPREIPRLLEPLASNFCDVVVGSRLGGKIRKGSLKYSNRVVNWGFTFLVRSLYRANVTDVLSGFFAWKHKAVHDLLPHLKSKGFTIEMEMITKMVKLKHEVYSVPITYDTREGESKISSMKDGVGILYMFFRNLSWKPEDTEVSSGKLSSKPKVHLKESF